ncbi:uncharacterized protein [Ptychodera flava]|uniref:uncharacterized protein n=1 Tax=Ptychodera flava TaxID=63121 RepID=UPI003969BF91
MKVAHIAVVVNLLLFQEVLVLTIPTTRTALTSPEDTATIGDDVDVEDFDNSLMKSNFAKQESFQMSVDELLKTLMFLTKKDACKEDSVVGPPNVTEVRSEFKDDQVIIRVAEEDNVVNYFVAYNGLGDNYNFALRSGKKTNLPLRNIPRDTVLTVEIFAMRRCMWQIMWSSSVYLEVRVSADDVVTVVTPPAPTPCEVFRPYMALEGKLSEDSMTVSMQPEPSIDRYLITMDTKTTRQQTYISNGPPGFGISGMTIGDLAPASMYKVTIMGETQCLGKSFHGPPIFFSVKTIGTRIDQQEYSTVTSPDQLELRIH